MAVKSTPLKGSASSRLSVFKNHKFTFASALILFEALLVANIIAYVPYTKIDWNAYMSQVSGFLGGERDYSNLEGDTGSLVYPAGFLYVYSAIKYVTGGKVFPAQILFGLLYIINLGIIFFIYMKTDVVLINPPLVTALLVSIGAVSVKMNILLYAPSLVLLMLKAMDITGVVTALSGAAAVQIILGVPFLIPHPVAYISRAFNLGRVFIHFCLVLLMGVELCWNVYPSNNYSSALLLFFHVVIVWGLWCAPSDYPYIQSKTSQKKIK